MPEFWLDSGYRLLDRTADGELAVTDDFLRAYLMRPEMEPVEESCDAERALHESLMIEPEREVSTAEIAAMADPDVRENYGVLMAFWDRLKDAGTLEKCYLDVVKSTGTQTPPLFINQLVQLILRNVLDGTADPLQVRTAEMLYRDQKISLTDGAVLAADADTVNLHAASGGFGSLGQLIVDAGTKLKSAELDVLGEGNMDNYWERSDRFDTAVDIRNPGEAIEAFSRVIELWVYHFFKAKVTVQPLREINDDQWVWHIGLDVEATKILNSLYQDEELGNATLARILGLFKLEFEDASLMRPDIAGRPVYLGMAMNEDNLLRLKPQNLIVNLPLAGFT